MEGIRDVRLEQSNTEEWAALAGPEWSDAEALHAHLRDHTNLLRAAQHVPWDELIGEGAVVLDLGCGAGWLTGMLTGHARVRRVIAWDLSLPLLTDLFPRMVQLVAGDIAKVERVCGSFTPLLLDDNSVDLVVMSSAFHHAPAPDVLLSELIRVVRPAGAIALLNEVPFPPLLVARNACAIGLAAVINSASSRFSLRLAGHVAADHVLYDPLLGDRAYTLSQWSVLFRRHRLAVTVIDSSFPSYAPDYRSGYWLERNLTHFILRQTAAGSHLTS